MHRKIPMTVCGVLLVGASFGTLAQTPEPAAVEPDGPQAIQHVEAAKKAAGTQWAAGEAFFCDPNPNRANRPDDPELEPTKLFDNLYVVGRVGTAVYAITTADGIILVDSGYADQVESLLLPSLKKLGLEPEKIRYVLVGHGHADHFGGAKYLQDHYGARVFVSQADWDLMERPARGRGPAPAAAAPASGTATVAAGVEQGRGGVPPTLPKRDMIAAEGTPITLGGETITVVSIPGHTPGSIGLIFPVKEGRATHVAALYGGTILIPRAIPDEGLQQYVQSVRHFANVTTRMKVDVEIQNHPLYDGILDKLGGLKQRRPGRPNPFVVGQTGYQNFLAVMSECTQAQLARRAGN